MTSITSATRVTAAAATCTVVWVDAEGVVRATVATPYVLDDRPALAWPYDRADLARSVGSAELVAMAFSDSRISGRGWQPLTMIGRPRLIEDRDGAIYRDSLLIQELRKYPPARALVDSPMLQREHWWYLPRIVVALEVDAITALAERAGGTADAVLGVVHDRRQGRALSVHSVQVPTENGWLAHSRVPVQVIQGVAPTSEGNERAVLLGHDFSTPDLERWESWTATGTWDGSHLLVEQSAGTIGLPPALGLMARIRRQQRLGAGCRAGLRR